MEIEKYLKKHKSLYNYYEVVGAGEIQISRSSNCKCGGVEGFSIAVSWGEHGFIGGVISKEEAWKLVKKISAELKMDII